MKHSMGLWEFWVEDGVRLGGGVKDCVCGGIILRVGGTQLPTWVGSSNVP